MSCKIPSCGLCQAVYAARRQTDARSRQSAAKVWRSQGVRQPGGQPVAGWAQASTGVPGIGGTPGGTVGRTALGPSDGAGCHRLARRCSVRPAPRAPSLQEPLHPGTSEAVDDDEADPPPRTSVVDLHQGTPPLAWRPQSGARTAGAPRATNSAGIGRRARRSAAMTMPQPTALAVQPFAVAQTGLDRVAEGV